MKQVIHKFDCIEDYYFEHGILKTAFRPRFWSHALERMVTLEPFCNTKQEAWRYAEKFVNELYQNY